MRLIPVLLLISLASPVYADFVKWVDKNGEVHYGTSIPPQYVNDAHVELNSRGIQVGQVGHAKTAQQLAQERTLAQMRKQQQKLAQEQRTRDQRLLNMYRSPDDLILERNGKFAQIDSLVKYKHQQIGLLTKRLNNLQAEAANQEREGHKIRPQLSEALASTEKQILDANASIAQEHANRKRLTEHYARDLARLRQLLGLDQPEQTKAAAQQSTSVSTTDMAWTFQCHSRAECDQLWPIAIDYLRQHATMPIQLQGPRIVSTAAPATPQDIGITLSRLQENGGDLLFLDVQCNASITGQQLCNSSPVQAIRDDFHSYLESHESKSN